MKTKMTSFQKQKYENSYPLNANKINNFIQRTYPNLKLCRRKSNSGSSYYWTSDNTEVLKYLSLLSTVETLQPIKLRLYEWLRDADNLMRNFISSTKEIFNPRFKDVMEWNEKRLLDFFDIQFFSKKEVTNLEFETIKLHKKSDKKGFNYNEVSDVMKFFACISNNNKYLLLKSRVAIITYKLQ